MEYQDRVNRPLGMSDVDLLIYDKDIYTLFRTHEGLETDAFRYDPIVSAGILASDYAYAQGMAWVNLLTPDSQDKINPGDGLIVPVQTYDNYKQNPPIEKYLTHEVSYTANELNLARAEGLHNEFVGDFNNYFDQESSLIRESVADTEEGTPAPKPTPTIPRTLFSGAWQPKTITTSIPRGVTESAIPPRTTYNQTYLNNLNNSTGTLVELKAKLKECMDYCKSKNIQYTIHCKKLIDKIKALSISTPVIASPTVPSTSGGSSTSGSSTSGGGTTTGGSSTSGGGEIIDGGAFPTGGGGGGMVGGGGAPSEAPAEETPKTDETKPKETKPETAKASEKLDMIPIYIGIAIFGLIGYYYANTQKKDVKTLGLAGGIIGGLLGYLYSQHQQKPIEFVTKLGIKSKSESGYFIDEI